MKPESHHALMELISFGVEELSNEDAALLMSRVQECHECTGQWVLFQKTYTVLSQTGQTEISVERSQQMWLTCLEHAKHHSAHPVALSHAAPEAHAPRSEVVPVSFRSDSSPREDDRRSPRAPFAPLQFLKRSFAPRLPFALAAGAFALLVSAYLAPSGPVEPPRIAVQTAALPAMPALPVVSGFQTPPRATTGLIDYHSALGFEPFSDHLAPTLVATSATRR